jgi:hypothetical protein
MHCPKCGENNEEGQHFCRVCGLAIDAVEKAYRAELRKMATDESWLSERFFGRLAAVSFFSFVAVAFGLLFSLTVYYKFEIFGKELMALFGVLGFLFLGVLSVVFYGLKKFVGGGAADEIRFHGGVPRRRRDS